MTYDEQIEIIQWAKDGGDVEHQDFPLLEDGWNLFDGKSFNFQHNSYRKVIKPREWEIVLCSGSVPCKIGCRDHTHCKGAKIVKVVEVLDEIS